MGVPHGHTYIVSMPNGKEILAEIKKAVEAQGSTLVKKVKGSIQFKLTNPDFNFVVDLSKGSGEAYEGTIDRANVTISLKNEDFGALYSGNLNAQSAFMQGKLKLKQHGFGDETSGHFQSRKRHVEINRPMLIFEY